MFQVGDRVTLARRHPKDGTLGIDGECFGQTGKIIRCLQDNKYHIEMGKDVWWAHGEMLDPDPLPLDLRVQDMINDYLVATQE